jgi:hypothetical protein
MSAASARRQLAPTVVILVRVHTARTRRQFALIGLRSEEMLVFEDESDVWLGVKIVHRFWRPYRASLSLSAPPAAQERKRERERERERDADRHTLSNT